MCRFASSSIRLRCCIIHGYDGYKQLLINNNAGGAVINVNGAGAVKKAIFAGGGAVINGAGAVKKGIINGVVSVLVLIVVLLVVVF